MEKVRNQQIYEKFKAGISADTIAKEEGVSRARVYQIINSMKARERVADLPLIDDSKTVNELKQRIAELEEENKNLRNDVRRLTDKLLSLI